MSLVNDMLKGLERRQSGRATLDGATLAGLGPAEETLPARSRARRWLIVSVMLLALLLGVALTQRGVPQGRLFTSVLSAVPPWPAASDAGSSKEGSPGPVSSAEGTADGPSPRMPSRVSLGGGPSHGVGVRPPGGVGPHRSTPGAGPVDGLGTPRIVAVALPEAERRDPKPQRRARHKPPPETARPAASGMTVADAKAASRRTGAVEGVVRMAADLAPANDLAVAFVARSMPPPRTSDNETAGGGTFTKKPVDPGAGERAEMLYHRARAAIDGGDPLRGESLLQEALVLDAGYVPARDMLIARRIRQSRLAEAQALLVRGLQAVPGHTGFAKVYARLLVDQGADERALRVLDTHAPELPADPPYHAFRAALLQRMGDHGLAAAVYREVLSVRPQVAVWWMGLGISLESLGRTQDARDAYRRAAESGRLSGELRDFVGSKLAELAD